MSCAVVCSVGRASLGAPYHLILLFTWTRTWVFGPSRTKEIDSIAMAGPESKATTIASPSQKQQQQEQQQQQQQQNQKHNPSIMMVNLAEDAELRLVSVLAESDATLQDSCSQQLLNPDQLLKSLISSSVAMKALMVELDAEEALGALSVLSVIATKSDSSLGLLRELTAQIATTGIDTDRKISFISILFNVAQDNADKSALLTTLLELASTTPSSPIPQGATALHPEGLIGRIIYPVTSSTALSMVTALGDETAQPPLTKIMHNWTTQQRCQVLDAVCKALAQTASHDQTEQVLCRQRYLLQYIQEDPTQTTVAVQAAIGAIRDPISLFRLQRNILQTVQPALSSKEPKLYELLKIVQQGTLSEYHNFVNKYGESTLKDWGLDGPKCEVNMRMLTVCSLANNYDADIPYKEIATAVQQDVSQVESTVIQAIRTGLLQAKMDQLNQTVMVERSVVRQFDMEQWKKLHARLATWKANVGVILDTLKQQHQVTGDGAVASQ